MADGSTNSKRPESDHAPFLPDCGSHSIFHGTVDSARLSLKDYSGPSSRKKSKGLERICAICGSVAKGCGYGAESCAACTLFFHRAVADSHKYFCRKSGHCIVDQFTRRSCAACRYKKCLECGMDPNAVQLHGSLVGQKRKLVDEDRQTDSENSRVSLGTTIASYFKSEDTPIALSNAAKDFSNKGANLEGPKRPALLTALGIQPSQREKENPSPGQSSKTSMSHQKSHRQENIHQGTKKHYFFSAIHPRQKIKIERRSDEDEIDVQVDTTKLDDDYNEVRDRIKDGDTGPGDKEDCAENNDVLGTARLKDMLHIKTEEYGDEGEKNSFNTSSSTIVVDDETDDGEGSVDNSCMEVFKSYRDIYKERRGSLVLTSAYKCAVRKVLKITTNHPEDIRGFNIAPAVPAFVFEDSKRQKILEKRLVAYVHKAQEYKRCLRIIQLAAPELLELRKHRKRISKENMGRIFKKLLDANKWSRCNPSLSSVLQFARPTLIATVIERVNGKHGNSAKVKNNHFPNAPKRSDKTLTEPRADNETTDIPCLEERSAVNREDKVMLEAQQKAGHKISPVESPNFVESSHGRHRSWISSTGSVPDRSLESPAPSSSRAAASEKGGECVEEILSKIGQIPNTDWDRRLANLRREISKSRLAEMLTATAGLPYEQQLALINRVVTEE